MFTSNITVISNVYCFPCPCILNNWNTFNVIFGPCFYSEQYFVHRNCSILKKYVTKLCSFSIKCKHYKFHLLLCLLTFFFFHYYNAIKFISVSWFWKQIFFHFECLRKQFRSFVLFVLYKDEQQQQQNGNDKCNFLCKASI